MSEPIQVLIAAPPMMRGGTERQLLYLAPRLPALGIDATFVLLAPRGPLEADLLATGARVLKPRTATRRPLRTWQQAQLIAREIERSRPHVIHSFLSEPHFAAALGRTMSSGPRPLLVHGRRSTNFYAAKRPLAGALERHLHKSCVALIGNSSALARELTEESGTPEKVGVIHNGAPIEALDHARPSREAARAGLGLSQSGLVMAVVANLFAYKRHSDVIAALAKIAARLPQDWRLLLAGREEGERASLEAQIADAGLAGNVVFLGDVADTSVVHAAADFEILASVQEGLSNALLEAMAAGVPAIVSDSGGNPDTVADGVTGLVIPTFNVDALSAAILRLADEPETRRRFGEAARARAERCFSMDVCATRHAQLWRGLVEHTGQPLTSWFDRPNC